MRLFFIVFLLADVYFICQTFGPYRLVMFFTNWTLMFTIAKLALCFICEQRGGNAKKAKSHKLLALTHIIAELASLMNVITVSIYWPLLHAETYVKAEYTCCPDRQVHAVFVHSVPAIACFVNFLMTDFVMKKSHAFLCVLFGEIYMKLNYDAQ